MLASILGPWGTNSTVIPLGFPGDVVVIYDVSIDLLYLDFLEACPSHKFPRFLLPPHRAETLTTKGERNCHAMEGGAHVHHWSEWVVQVLMDVARTGDVRAQEDTVGGQGIGYAFQDLPWLRLVVDGVENSDQVEQLRTIQRRRIL